MVQKVHNKKYLKWQYQLGKYINCGKYELVMYFWC